MHQPPPFPLDEEERLRALRRYRILDTEPEPQFDRIVDIAKRRFDVPIALVAFMDSGRNFLKARGDLPMSESPRELSFCGHTILDDEILFVGDATKDCRFVENPLVIGEFNIRFYAGAPLIASSGHRIGTICVFDTRPRQSFSDEDRRDLKDLALIVTDFLEMRLIIGDVHDEIEIRRAAEARAHELAYHDVLTGLPNRAHLQKIASEGLPFSRQGVLAVFAADLDEFKTVNDTFGHHAGDELLRRTATAIKARLGQRAFVARMSGDEFVAVLDGESRETVQDVASDIVEATARPGVLAGRMISNGVSIGVAFADGDRGDIDMLLRNADLALCAAKKSGRRRAVVFDEKLAIETRRTANLKHDLITAVKDHAIKVFFQPIHRARDRSMVGVEALARWSHPQIGPVSPAEFITLAEEGGQILELGDYILRATLRAAVDWNEISYVSVNLSPVQFRLDDLVPNVAAILADARFPARRLQLEITESVLFDDCIGAKRQIEALSEIGVRVALDDFGTGYSGLNYLADLPFTKVKIDRSFVKGMRYDRKRHAIIRHIVAMARGLDMTVTAEGVETEDDAVLLSAAGCTSLQGFYFGEAMPAVGIGARLSSGRPAA
jgi:diguanylate cyclase (GGDEF)-like protein